MTEANIQNGTMTAAQSVAGASVALGHLIPHLAKLEATVMTHQESTDISAFSTAYQDIDYIIQMVSQLEKYLDLVADMVTEAADADMSSLLQQINLGELRGILASGGDQAEKPTSTPAQDTPILFHTE